MDREGGGERRPQLAILGSDQRVGAKAPRGGGALAKIGSRPSSAIAANIRATAMTMRGLVGFAVFFIMALSDDTPGV